MFLSIQETMILMFLQLCVIIDLYLLWLYNQNVNDQIIGSTELFGLNLVKIKIDVSKLKELDSYNADIENEISS